MGNSTVFSKLWPNENEIFHSPFDPEIYGELEAKNYDNPLVMKAIHVQG